MNYCTIYGDYDQRELYWGKEPKINVQYCPKCKMVVNKDEAISEAVKIQRWRNKKFFFSTNDGVFIAGHRFYELYHQYQMSGIEFIPFEKSQGYFVCRFINIMKFDLERAKQVCAINSDGTKTFGVLDNGMCPVCQKSLGHHYPWPYRMIPEDEEILMPNTFYRSDIEFRENFHQSPIIWATDGIIQAFSKEKFRIFYKNVEGDFGKGDCGKN